MIHISVRGDSEFEAIVAAINKRIGEEESFPARRSGEQLSRR